MMKDGGDFSEIGIMISVPLIEQPQQIYISTNNYLLMGVCERGELEVMEVENGSNKHKLQCTCESCILV